MIKSRQNLIFFSGGGGAGNRGDHRGDRDRGGDRERSIMDRLGPQPASSGFGNTYGLSTQFLESLGIDGPLHTRVFVANVSSVCLLIGQIIRNPLSVM